MAVNALDTVTLLGVKQRQEPFEAFFLNMFFPSQVTFDSEEIAFDKIKKGVKLAPFVSPVVAGRARKKEGAQLVSFVPAYVKPHDIVRPDHLLKRRPGELIGGSSTPQTRRLATIAQLLGEQEQSIVHREEWMAVQAVCTGKVIVEGQDYPKKEVDFLRNADNNVVLTAGAKWDAVNTATYDPTDDIEDWAALASGPVELLIMDKATWRTFRSFAVVKDKLDTTQRGSTSSLQLGPQVSKTVSYKGNFGEYDIYVYSGKYTDESGNEQYFMPANTLLLAPRGYDGVRAYGAIMDAKANASGVVATSRYAKNWFTEDPSVENLQTQSAPLMVTPDPDAFVAVKTF